MINFKKDERWSLNDIGKHIYTKNIMQKKKILKFEIEWDK
jgi:hypothetical protein